MTSVEEEQVEYWPQYTVDLGPEGDQVFVDADKHEILMDGKLILFQGETVVAYFKDWSYFTRTQAG